MSIVILVEKRGMKSSKLMKHSRRSCFFALRILSILKMISFKDEKFCYGTVIQIEQKIMDIEHFDIYIIFIDPEYLD